MVAPPSPRAAKADGIAERTLQRARDRAGVTTERKSFGAGAVWTKTAKVLPFASPEAHSRQSRQASHPGMDGANGGRDAAETPPIGAVGCGPYWVYPYWRPHGRRARYRICLMSGHSVAPRGVY